MNSYEEDKLFGSFSLRHSLRASCPAISSLSPVKTSPPGGSSSNNSFKFSSSSVSNSLSTTPALRYLTDFEELQDVGKGGFGTVVKVKNRLDERDYAVKKIKLSRRNDSNTNKKILREVSTLSRLCHENVVRYYQVIYTTILFSSSCSIVVSFVS